MSCKGCNQSVELCRTCKKAVKTCHLCGITDEYVTKKLPLYVGGHGYIPFPVCQCRSECLERVMNQRLERVNA